MTRLCLGSALTLALALAASAADWPRFRGPNGTGVAEGPLPPIDPKAPSWKVAIPGKGVGSPIVVGGKVYLQTASTDGSKRTLLCLDAATGQAVWAKDHPGQKGHTHQKNSLASSTPASDGEQVYCVWWDGVAVSVVAYDLAGNEKWSTSLGSFTSQHGAGHSPVVYKGRVYVNFDQDKDPPKGKADGGGPSMVVALDAKTGSKVWTAERKGQVANYTTPVIVERPGKPAAVVVATTTGLDSYDAETGKVNWHYSINWPAGVEPLRGVGSPVVAGGAVVGYTGQGAGKGSRYAVAVKLDSTGDATKTGKAWEITDGSPYVPSILVKGDRLFWVHDNGRAYCADANTGKLVAPPQEVFGGSVTASPILVGDSIVAISERGQLAVVKADPDLEVARKVDLGEEVLASPAFADGRLYVRGKTHLFCFGKK